MNINMQGELVEKLEAADQQPRVLGGIQVALADIKQAAHILLGVAADVGVMLTIEQVPLEPLAMGHYKSVVSVHPARAASEEN